MNVIGDKRDGNKIYRISYGSSIYVEDNSELIWAATFSAAETVFREHYTDAIIKSIEVVLVLK